MAFKINPITGKMDYYEASGVPGDHAGTHVTGGGDTIASAVAGGNAGLMTGADKTKLDGIASGAEVNVNADWNSGSGDSQILNKPTIPTLDYKLKVSTDDTTPNWLSSKIDAGDALGSSVSDEGANEVLKLDVQTQMSITYDVSGLKLSGDSSTPGATMLYGTNGSGTKGWYAQPSGSYTDEQAQDAVGAMADANSLTYTDATPLLAVKRQMSITADASGIKLDGDVASPGNSYLYGTNSSGTKGWYAQPAGGSATGVLSDLQITVLQSDGTLNAASGVQTWAGTDKTAQDVFTLVANKTYRVRGQWIVNTGTTTHTTAMAWSTSATITSFQYLVMIWSAAANTPTTTQSTVHVSGVSSKVLNATSTAVYTIIKFEGIMVVGNTGGEITPQINFSADPTGDNYMKRGSWTSFELLGADTMTLTGGWA